MAKRYLITGVTGIRGDVATGEIGLNLAAREWREGQFFRYHFGQRLLV